METLSPGLPFPSPASLSVATMDVWPEYLQGDAYYAARQAILQGGLPVQLSVKWYDQELLVVEVTPRPGFVHLTRNWEECIGAYGPYHISVVFSPGVGLTDDYLFVRSL